MKRCKKCGEEKPLEAFWKVAKAKDGRENMCAVCCNERRKARELCISKPNILAGLEVKENGLYPMYWEQD